MDYVNSDGSIGEMCGNGIRCLALFALAEGLAEGRTLAVDTRAGRKVVEVLDHGSVRVDMGPPAFSPHEIPVHAVGSDILHLKLEVGGRGAGEMVEAACLSMGNPHAVVFVDEPSRSPVATLGPAIETHPVFPNKTNVEFVRVRNPRLVEMRVWERGAGETLACGTGACAAAVAARLLAKADEHVTVVLPGGELEISWTGSRDTVAPVLMTGPARESFRGEIDLEHV